MNREELTDTARALIAGDKGLLFGMHHFRDFEPDGDCTLVNPGVVVSAHELECPSKTQIIPL